MPSSASVIAPEDQRQLLAALRAVRKELFKAQSPAGGIRDRGVPDQDDTELVVRV